MRGLLGLTERSSVRPFVPSTSFRAARLTLASSRAIADGSMSSKKEMKPYKGQVVFNSEDDIHVRSSSSLLFPPSPLNLLPAHFLTSGPFSSSPLQFPNLAVGHTLDFALRNNTPHPSARPPKEDGSIPSADEYDAKFKGELLKIFGLEHTVGTKVGDEYIRGVSGGEKKRVSIAEVLTSRASVQCWDNATRGLDANTALTYTQIMRALTDVSRNTTVVSLCESFDATRFRPTALTPLLFDAFRSSRKPDL